MQYEINAQRIDELDEGLTSFTEQRRRFNQNQDRRQAERAMEGQARRLVSAARPDDAGLVFNYLEATHPEEAPMSQKSCNTHIREAWMGQPIDSLAALMPDLDGLPSEEPGELEKLPANAFVLKISFRLAKPYMSRDDATFHVLDNPVRKEWIFRVPMMAAASWKGALRTAFWQRGQHDDDPAVQRLFGYETGDEGGQRGFLQFFPTFFEAGSVSIEMINPHDRSDGVGSNPIAFEAVGARRERSDLWLLYAPPGLVELAAAAEDLQQVADAAKELLTMQGIGAKTSAGYGTAEEGVSGTIHVRAALPPFSAAAAEEPGSEVEAETALTEWEQWLLTLLDDGSGAAVGEEEFLRRVDENWPAGKKKPKKWKKYEGYYKKLSGLMAAPADEEAEMDGTAEKEPELFSAEFFSFDELQQVIDHIGRNSGGGGE